MIFMQDSKNIIQFKDKKLLEEPYIKIRPIAERLHQVITDHLAKKRCS